MAFTQTYNGQTFPPYTTFPPNVYLKGCTLQAPCIFQGYAILKDCTFQKCCPQYYQNPNSQITSGRIYGGTLEYVEIGPKVHVYNAQDTGNRVINQGWTRGGVTHGTQGEITGTERDCCQHGISIAPGETKGQPFANNCGCVKVERGIKNESKG